MHCIKSQVFAATSQDLGLNEEQSLNIANWEDVLASLPWELNHTPYVHQGLQFVTVNHKAYWSWQLGEEKKCEKKVCKEGLSLMTVLS